VSIDQAQEITTKSMAAVATGTGASIMVALMQLKVALEKLG